MAAFLVAAGIIVILYPFADGSGADVAGIVLIVCGFIRFIVRNNPNQGDQNDQ